MKKLLSCLLAVAMLLSLMTFTAVAAEKIDAPLNPKAALPKQLGHDGETRRKSCLGIC